MSWTYTDSTNLIVVNSDNTRSMLASSQEIQDWVAEGNTIGAAPSLSPKQIKDEALADITWTRPSDSVEIQIRHPDFASDFIVMEKARDSLSDGESRSWIAKDNSAITMSKQDMIDCLAYGESEVDSIMSTYISTL